MRSSGLPTLVGALLYGDGWRTSRKKPSTSTFTHKKKVPFGECGLMLHSPKGTFK